MISAQRLKLARHVNAPQEQPTKREKLPPAHWRRPSVVDVVDMQRPFYATPLDRAFVSVASENPRAGAFPCWAFQVDVAIPILAKGHFMQPVVFQAMYWLEFHPPVVFHQQ